MSTVNPQCQHIMSTGLRCATPPMKGNQFCYHHRRLHDNHCLPGHPDYEPEVLDSPQGITVMLHHLELAMNKRLITLKDYKARLFAIHLAITNMKLAVQNTPEPEALVTEYTPAMRDLHHLNANEPCSDDLPSPDGVPANAPLDPPCPIEFLQPPDMTEPTDPNRLWYPMGEEEMCNMNHPREGQLGTLEQEIAERRLRLHLLLARIPNPTRWQIEQALSQIDDEEMAISPDLYRRRVWLLQQLQK